MKDIYNQLENAKVATLAIVEQCLSLGGVFISPNEGLEATLIDEDAIFVSVVRGGQVCEKYNIDLHGKWMVKLDE